MNDEEQRAKNAEKQRKWRAANRERAREQARENARRWREANPERAKELNETSRLKRRARDPEGERAKDRERVAAWRAENPERNRENDRNWREANPEASREKQQRWREAHPDRVAENNIAYSEERKERRQNDPEWAQEQRERAVEWARTNPEKIVKNYIKYRSDPKNVLRDQYKAAKKRAAEIGVPWDETLLDDDWIDAAPLHCESCGILFDLAPANVGEGRTVNPRARSIDRIIPIKGYVRANIGYLCYRHNTIKNDATADELRTVAAYIDRRLARPQ